MSDVVSNNQFPKVIGVEQASDPAAPAAGTRKLYAKSDGWYDMDDTGAATAVGGGGSVQDTGWRVIVASGAISGLPNLTANLRRVGNVCMAAIGQPTSGATTSTAQTLIDLPDGFRHTAPTADPWATGVVYSNTVTVLTASALYIIPAAPYSLVLKPTSGQRHYGHIMWLTGDSWPATLPGTAG